MGVSKNNGTPKSSILIGFYIVNHPFWGTPIFGNTHITTPNNALSLGEIQQNDRTFALLDPPKMGNFDDPCRSFVLGQWRKNVAIWYLVPP